MTSRLRLFAPVSSTTETQEIVRKRVFSVRSLDDISGVLAILKREGFVGSVKIHIGQGGTPNSIESEERSKL